MRGIRGRQGIYDIAVIGSRGTGKTSLISSMYGEFNNDAAMHGLRLVSRDPRTTRYLNGTLGRLQSIASELVVREPGIGANPLEFKELSFDLAEVGKDDKHVRIRFTDYPGEWTGVHELLRRRVGASPALLVAIDAPSLMWEQGRLNGLWNTPDLINRAVGDWLASDSTGKQLVIFCPIKCEKWVQEASGRAELERAVRTQFRGTIGSLAASPQTRVIYAPVQTTGSLRHNRFEWDPEKSQWDSKFLGTPNGSYSPAWVLNPLIASLAAIGEQVGTDEGFWNWLYGRNRSLKRAARDFYRRPLEGPARIWQQGG